MTTKIGFDLDGVFINSPPFIPKQLIEKLYKKSGDRIFYRYPGKLEQMVRILSHAPILRPPIKSSLSLFKKANVSNTYLISSRFSFLKDRTKQWDRKNDIFKHFKAVYFNDKDEQPHFFKDRIIKKERIDKFIDDDLDLLLFLSKENPNVEFYWINNSSQNISLPYNVKRIKTFSEFLSSYV